jgi:TPP-dependent pyruvate/acetoin dehydrogenase alpha subunit
VNLAAVWKLPVVFVCENNVYGFSTHYRRTMLLENIADRAAGYGIPGKVVDGMDLRAVHTAAGGAIARARSGGGPTLVECKTYRFMGHSRFEPSSYRTKEELAEWKKKDPIVLFRSVLVNEICAPEAEIGAVERAVEESIEEAVRFAECSPDPAPDDWRRWLFAGEEA